MKKLLVTAAALAALALPAQADQIVLADNPTSATGNFSFAPIVGAFEDQVIFDVTGAPAYFTIANATNVFAAPTDMIQNWMASIWSAGADQVVNNADDQLLFGPQAAAACLITPNCQIVGGSGILSPSGTYYAEFTGIGSGTSGYSGNISTFAVPGPAVGAGFPALFALGLLGFNYLRRRRNAA
jgi:hypothetical protein